MTRSIFVANLGLTTRFEVGKSTPNRSAWNWDDCLPKTLHLRKSGAGERGEAAEGGESIAGVFPQRLPIHFPFSFLQQFHGLSNLSFFQKRLDVVDERLECDDLAGV